MSVIVENELSVFVDTSNTFKLSARHAAPPPKKKTIQTIQNKIDLPPLHRFGGGGGGKSTKICYPPPPRRKTQNPSMDDLCI